MALPVAVAVAVSTAVALVAAAALSDVREQRELTRALDRPGELTLVAPARPSDPAGADLPAVGDEPAER